MPRPPIHWPEPRGDIHITRGKRGIRATTGAPTEGSPGASLTKQDKWFVRLQRKFDETLDKADAAQRISRNKGLPARLRKQAEESMLKHIKDADKISDRLVKSSKQYFSERGTNFDEPPPRGPKGGGGGRAPKPARLTVLRGGRSTVAPKTPGPGKLARLAEGAGRLGRGVGRVAGVMGGVGIILEAIKMAKEVEEAKEAQQKRLRNADLLM